MKIRIIKENFEKAMGKLAEAPEDDVDLPERPHHELRLVQPRKTPSYEETRFWWVVYLTNGTSAWFYDNEVQANKFREEMEAKGLYSNWDMHPVGTVDPVSLAREHEEDQRVARTP